MEASADYHEDHVPDQLKITASPKGSGSRQFRTTLVDHCGSDGCLDVKKLKDHVTTRSIDCLGLEEQKLENQTTVDFTQFRNEMEAYSL